MTPPAAAARPARVLRVDDASASRQAMRRILGGSCGAAVVGAASNGEDALAEAAETAMVYGMPQAAAEGGAVEELLPLPALAGRVVRSGSGH